LIHFYKREMKSLTMFALMGCALAQKPARIGPDGKPLLNRPDIEECMKRKTHMKVGNHNYFLSWREPWHKFEDWDWFNGRNFCRDRCMDLISFDTPGEFKIFEEIMARDNVTSIYTSGRKCNFQNKGCDLPHLQPINVNGWFWAGAGNGRIPPTNQPNPESFWSGTGQNRVPQPDNQEGIEEGPISADNSIGITIEGLQEFHDEACLAVLNNKFGDGIKWHDVACHFRSVIICEDSDQLINLIATQEGVDVRDEADEGTNSIDVDSLPRLPELSSPAAPVPIRQQQQFVQPPPQFAPQTEFQFGGQRPPPLPQRPLRPQRPQRPPPSRNPFSNIFSNFRLPFF
jgi:hypothetical protein